MIPINEKYRIVFDKTDPKKWCVELLSACDPFHGILLSYGKFNITTSDGDEQKPKVKFETDIIYVPERLKDVTLPDEKYNEMEDLLAMILFDILENNLDKTKSDGDKLFLELIDEHNK